MKWIDLLCMLRSYLDCFNGGALFFRLTIEEEKRKRREGQYGSLGLWVLGMPHFILV
jgi:hypothetical protein